MDAREIIHRWLNGRASIRVDGQIQFSSGADEGLSARFRRAYRWIADQSLLPGTMDLEWDVRHRIGHQSHEVRLSDRESYSSFVLLPLLTLMTSRRMVFIGAPGHGKTSMATLMALIAGYSLKETRRAIQHGHPQLTITDLLGSPLPSDLVNARSTADITVFWREWLRMRVKIIDEYNRIPTRTQSALLSMMADGYAEMFEQVVETGPSAWFLTANDDLGGGTFPVIEALKDRIDVVVRCAPFHSKNLSQLLRRVTMQDEVVSEVPEDIRFSVTELDQADREIRAVDVPADVLDLLAFFLGQLDFCRQASSQVDSMNKDTLHLSGRRVSHVCNEDCPLDKLLNLCSQTECGVSPRTHQSILHYSKALAYFRGKSQVSVEDVRNLIPWLLFDKVRMNAQSHFFQKPENRVFLSDRAGWLRQMFDRAIQQHAAYLPVRTPILRIEAELQSRNSLGSADLLRLQQTISGTLRQLLEKHELNGPVHDDVMRLKLLYSKCCDISRDRQGG